MTAILTILTTLIKVVCLDAMDAVAIVTLIQVMIVTQVDVLLDRIVATTATNIQMKIEALGALLASTALVLGTGTTATEVETRAAKK